jgi:hypothetical protein
MSPSCLLIGVCAVIGSGRWVRDMGVDVIGGEVEEAGAGGGVRGQDGAATGLSREEGASERATPHPQPRPQG